MTRSFLDKTRARLIRLASDFSESFSPLDGVNFVRRLNRRPTFTTVLLELESRHHRGSSAVVTVCLEQQSAFAERDYLRALAPEFRYQARDIVKRVLLRDPIKFSDINRRHIYSESHVRTLSIFAVSAPRREVTRRGALIKAREAIINRTVQAEAFQGKPTYSGETLLNEPARPLITQRRKCVWSGK